MGARRTARERALQALYQLEMTPGSIGDALEAAWAATEEARKEAEAVKFAREEANNLEITDQRVGDVVFDYLFR